MIITVIIIFVLALSFINTFSPSLSMLKENVFLSQDTRSQVEISVTEKQSTTPYPYQASILETSTPKTQTFEITTKIVSGPKHNEVIDETNKITFEFDLKIPDPDQRTRFQTKVLGFDSEWKSTYSKKRTITLPPGPKEYTFLVREKEKAETTLPAQRIFKLNISPYFDKVEISRVQTQTSSRSSLITLSTHLKKKEEVNITGWQIKGKQGSFVIPEGIEKYRTYYSPVPTESIFVKRGDKIYLSSALNPLGRGINFRPNKCLGYLTNYPNYRDFAISLSKKCPRPTKEEISGLDPCCQEFIFDNETCKIPDYSSNFIILSDSECVFYLNENFNYDGCFRNYFRDEDFIMKNWHIYMNRNLVVSNSCDTFYLRDQNNLFIDKYTYGKAQCSW